jgi:hypothetical protein
MPIPVGYAQANLRFGGSALPTGAEITIGLDVSGFPGTVADVAELVGDSYEAEVLGGQCSSVSLDEVLVKYGPDATGPSAVYAVNGVGAESGAATPPNVSLLVHKQTALGGRAGRGRMYIPGWPEADIDAGGNWGAGWVTGRAGDLTSWLNALDAGSAPAVLLHQPGSPIAVPTPSTALAPQAIAATQRQRLRR